MTAKKETIIGKVFLQREFQATRLAYDKELAFYEAVQKGDFKSLKRLMIPLEDERLGRLSNNPLRNLKYHLIITTALITRFCIEGGLPLDTAYTLSDLYIQQIDMCSNAEAVSLLHKELVFEFAKKMKDLRSSPGESKSVRKTIDYINEHLQERLSLNKISSELKINKSYLCELFKKETGVTIHSYILKKKIEGAIDLLLQSELPPQKISDYFSFSSPSHFSATFKKATGFTPENYRKNTYGRHWKK